LPFWLVSALTEIGREHFQQARDICEKILSYAARCCSTARRSTPAGPAAGQLPPGVHGTWR